MSSARYLAAIVSITACGGGADHRADDASGFVDARPRPDADSPAGLLGPLPLEASASSEDFVTHDRCATCHAASSGDALRDASGRDVSPVHEFRGSMMSLAGRDPYWLAAFAHELSELPAATGTIEATCTRCHMPAANVERAKSGSTIHYDEITSSTDAIAVLGRDGATCTACHQIGSEGLGTDASFTGGYIIDGTRRIFVPYADPLTMPMQRNVGYTPTGAAHIGESAVCATCHTVITRALDDSGVAVGPEFPEQVPYLEWRASAFSTETAGTGRPTSCQSCHMPRVDEDGATIATAISTRPSWLGTRTPFGRHLLVGGNATMLAILAEETDWLGAGDPATLRASAELTRAFARTAAAVEIAEATTAGDDLAFVVRVRNLSGHRFPTAYPSRRAWLHVRVRDRTGAVVFESGGHDATGALVDRDGARLDGLDAELPHRLSITSEEQVQVYGTRMGDANGAPTHTLLRATRYLADNRLLPEGWSADHPDARLTSPVGTESDPDFRAGGDDVSYRVHAPGAARVEVTLRFQTVPPEAVEAVSGSPAGARLAQMLAAHPQEPVVIAEAARDL